MAEHSCLTGSEERFVLCKMSREGGRERKPPPLPGTTATTSCSFLPHSWIGSIFTDAVGPWNEPSHTRRYRLSLLLHHLGIPSTYIRSWGQKPTDEGRKIQVQAFRSGSVSADLGNATATSTSCNKSPSSSLLPVVVA